MGIKPSVVSGNQLRQLAVAFVSALLLVPAASAQEMSGIAGIVRDTTGAVLPGVTVEATSLALIEKVRTVVTDGQGVYDIVDLRPGTYTVTFTLANFGTVKREELELTTGFTATINAELRVGEVAGTITVMGGSPVVDTRNVAQQPADRIQRDHLWFSRPSAIGAPTVTIPSSQIRTKIPGCKRRTSATPRMTIGRIGM